MSTEHLDQALTELVELKWQWVNEGKSAEIGKQLEEKAGKLAAEVPDEYKEFVNSIQNEAQSAPAASSMGATSPSATPKGATPAPRPDEESPAPVEEVLMTMLSKLGDEVPESELERINSLIEQLPTPAETSLAKGAGQLPVRNNGDTTAGHVQLFTQSNGLVHGGVINIGSSRLVCRAFRFYRKSLFGNPGFPKSQQFDVVAGVCEQMDASGNVVQRWTTAERLTDMYQSTSQPLPSYACRHDHQPDLTEGFYRGAQFTEIMRQALQAAIRKRPINVLPFEVPDTVPDQNYYLGKESRSFAEPPGPDMAVETPLYNKMPTASEGYVINTPYLSVFSPNPSLPVVVVSMLSAYREAFLSHRDTYNVVTGQVGPQIYAKQKLTQFKRQASWSVRSFKLS